MTLIITDTRLPTGQNTMTYPMAEDVIIYPDSDGEPMADNTKQYRLMTRVKGGLDIQFQSRADVFVAGDLLWYPVQGDNRTRMAPDVMVAFGRPKGDRGSYRQWEERGIAPQWVMEVLSPGNRAGEMATKLAFYDRYGVQEYVCYDPDDFVFRVWTRQNGALTPVPFTGSWTSPLLGVWFVVPPGQPLEAFHPDGTPFRDVVELDQERAREAARADAAEQRVRDLIARLQAAGITPDSES